MVIAGREVTLERLDEILWSVGNHPSFQRITGYGPLNGGCAVYAQALHELIPGSSLRGVWISPEGGWVHAIVQYDTFYMDGTGIRTAQEIIDHWKPLSKGDVVISNPVYEDRCWSENYGNVEEIVEDLKKLIIRVIDMGLVIKYRYQFSAPAVPGEHKYSKEKLLDQRSWDIMPPLRVYGCCEHNNEETK